MKTVKFNPIQLMNWLKKSNISEEPSDNEKDILSSIGITRDEDIQKFLDAMKAIGAKSEKERSKVIKELIAPYFNAMNTAGNDKSLTHNALISAFDNLLSQKTKNAAQLNYKLSAELKNIDKYVKENGEKIKAENELQKCLTDYEENQNVSKEDFNKIITLLNQLGIDKQQNSIYAERDITKLNGESVTDKNELTFKFKDIDYSITFVNEISFETLVENEVANVLSDLNPDAGEIYSYETLFDLELYNKDDGGSYSNLFNVFKEMYGIDLAKELGEDAYSSTLDSYTVEDITNALIKYLKEPPVEENTQYIAEEDTTTPIFNDEEIKELADLIKENLPNTSKEDIKSMIDELTKKAESKGVDPTDYVSSRLVDFLVMRAENPNMSLDKMNNSFALDKITDLALTNINSIYKDIYGKEPDGIDALLEMQDLAIVYCDQEPSGRNAYLNFKNLVYMRYAKDGSLTGQEFYNGIVSDLVNIFPQQIQMTYEELDGLAAKIQKLSPEKILELTQKTLSLPSINDENYQAEYDKFIAAFNSAVKNSDYNGINNSSAPISLEEVYKLLSGVEFNPDRIINANSQLENISDAISATINYQTALNIFDSVKNGDKDEGSALWQIGVLYTGSTEAEDIENFLREITGNSNLYVEDNKVVIPQIAASRGGARRSAAANKESSILDTVADWCKSAWKSTVDFCISDSQQEIDANSDLSSISGVCDYITNTLSNPDFYRDFGNWCQAGALGCTVASAAVVDAPITLTSAGVLEMIGGASYAFGATLDFIQNPDTSSNGITNFIAKLMEGGTTMLGGKYINAAFEVPAALTGFWNQIKNNIATSNLTLKLTDYALQKTTSTGLKTINRHVKTIEKNILKSRRDSGMGGYLTYSVEKSGILNVDNLPKLTKKHINDLLELDKEGNLGRMAIGYQYISASNLRIAPYIKDDIELIRNGIKSTVKEFSVGTKFGRLLEELPVGEVAELNGKLYMRVGENQLKELELSREMYDKLFPPLNRFVINQGDSQSCWFLSACARKYIEPESRYELVKLFSQVGDDVYVKLPSSNLTYKFTNGEVPDLRELGYEDWDKLSNSSSWTNMLELAAGFVNKNTDEWLIGRNFVDFVNQKPCDLKGWCVSFDQNNNPILDVNKYVEKVCHYLAHLDSPRYESTLKLFGKGEYLLTGVQAEVREANTVVDAMQKLPKGRNISMGILFDEAHAATITRVEHGRIYITDPILTYFENFIPPEFFNAFVSHVSNAKYRSVATSVLAALLGGATAANAQTDTPTQQPTTPTTPPATQPTTPPTTPQVTPPTTPKVTPPTTPKVTPHTTQPKTQTGSPNANTSHNNEIELPDFPGWETGTPIRTQQMTNVDTYDIPAISPSGDNEASLSLPNNIDPHLSPEDLASTLPIYKDGPTTYETTLSKTISIPESLCKSGPETSVNPFLDDWIDSTISAYQEEIENQLNTEFTKEYPGLNINYSIDWNIDANTERGEITIDAEIEVEIPGTPWEDGTTVYINGAGYVFGLNPEPHWIYDEIG